MVKNKKINAKNKKKEVKHKKAHGQYFTVENVFDNACFREYNGMFLWNKTDIVEPFAGSKNLARLYEEVYGRKRWEFFDIEPLARDIQLNDSILNPIPAEVVITNPPYFSKSMATKGKYNIPPAQFRGEIDLYLASLKGILEHANYASVILPRSILTTKMGFDRCYSLNIFTEQVFEDTQVQVVMVNYIPRTVEDVKVYIDGSFAGFLKDLQKEHEQWLGNKAHKDWENVKYGEKYDDHCVYLNHISTGSGIKAVPIAEYNRLEQDFPKGIRRWQRQAHKRYIRLADNVDVVEFCAVLNEQIALYRRFMPLFGSKFKGNVTVDKLKESVSRRLVDKSLYIIEKKHNT